MLWILASILLVAWIVSLALKVTTGIIHVLLVAAIILYVFGFVRGRRGTATV
jgi:Family of unknown function (DUF5670)